MQRETIIFTPEGSSEVFELKTYVTQLEKRAIEKAYATIKDGAKENDLLAISHTLENEAIKCVVVKMGDITDGDQIITAVLNFPSTVYASFYKKVKEIVDGAQKKTS